MHEVGLMQQTLELALASAQEQGAQTIHKLTMRIGPLAGVVPEALQFAFEVVTPGTMAAGATLEVLEVPAVCWCPECASEFQPADFIFACPHCGQLSQEIRQGRELELLSLEVS